MLAHAHDNAVMGSSASQPKQYNPWRPIPRGWGNHHKHSAVMVQKAIPLVYAVPMHPIHARQFEYRNYVQQVNPYYGNGGLPWWSDTTAVPYGPWSQGNGWPNGLW